MQHFRLLTRIFVVVVLLLTLTACGAFVSPPPDDLLYSHHPGAGAGRHRGAGCGEAYDGLCRAGRDS